MSFNINRGFFIFAVIAAAIFAGLCWLGVIDGRRLLMKLRVTASNTTSQVTSGIGLPEAQKAGGNAIASANACRENLRRIESAKKAVAQKTGVTVGNVSWDAVMKEMGGKMPKCPAGGTYVLGTQEIRVKCSIAANGTTDHADDHLLDKF